MNTYLYEYTKLFKLLGCNLTIYTPKLKVPDSYKYIFDQCQVLPIRKAFTIRLYLKIKFAVPAIFVSRKICLKLGMNRLGNILNRIYVLIDQKDIYQYIFKLVNSKKSYDLIFIMYLDFFDSQIFLNLLPKDRPKLAGILFHPNLLDDGPIESYLSNSLLKNVIFLHPNATNMYRSRCPDTEFYCASELGSYNPNQDIITNTVRGHAENRKVISMIGNITVHKNIDLFLQIIDKFPENQFFFLFAGRIDDALPLHIKNVLSNISSKRNVYTAFGYFDDEGELDSYIAASDFLFGIYRDDWTGSANILVKGALSSKPILGNKNNFLGSQIDKFSLGITYDVNLENLLTTILDSLSKEVWVQPNNTPDATSISNIEIVREILFSNN
jgi:glycosyltransferase involved in cell wall biosynthesis